MKIIEDNIFFQKKDELASTIIFLKAIKLHAPSEIALKIAEEAAANQSFSYYKKVFQKSDNLVEERFNTFRKNYEAYPKKVPYCKILISNKKCLQVEFLRCPYAEVLQSENLSEFTEASCASDIAFTEKFLPGIIFTRESSIVEGDKTCIMKWQFKD